MKSEKNKKKTKKDDFLSAKNYTEFSKLKKNHYKENIFYSLQSVKGNNEEVKEDFKKFSEHFQKSFYLFFYIFIKLIKKGLVSITSFFIWFFFFFEDFFKIKNIKKNNYFLENNSEFLENKNEVNVF